MTVIWENATPMDDIYVLTQLEKMDCQMFSHMVLVSISSIIGETSRNWAMLCNKSNNRAEQIARQAHGDAVKAVINCGSTVVDSEAVVNSFNLSISIDAMINGVRKQSGHD